MIYATEARRTQSKGTFDANEAKGHRSTVALLYLVAKGATFHGA